jgi:hypothetical protein
MIILQLVVIFLKRPSHPRSNPPYQTGPFLSSPIRTKALLPFSPLLQVPLPLYHLDNIIFYISFFCLLSCCYQKIPLHQMLIFLLQFFLIGYTIFIFIFFLLLITIQNHAIFPGCSSIYCVCSTSSSCSNVNPSSFICYSVQQ